ncbi:Benzaldehyde dehydrogenase [NAD(+)] [Streptomyces ambofaciens ATCC 23877]|uniref:Benzaldehyde dehydrogenase [NAD(+)] n=1 Tax=Streptomyces ambofaciens (strain ATCC 23877 / 3486 / DSM 40053 / JCM 4204 / NBRC 12836 / NRRL B-2516) TaxID=278992 RepID=A3KIZ2_STRA7|nr:benzaldehyde dehydrogenase [Streptomyces ambofaciens]AKZ53818.1 Benzaldehyde dehydrogenase [NAD(+)] [Streptomyces ambofaciens ATCC 23877]CAJ89676.1 putative aldehyde dehydrogenase [Streptomyces ambofaciens ATCC 23877]
MTFLDSDVWGRKFFSDGWQDSPAEHPVTEPATGERLGAVGLVTPEDVGRAAARAAEAQREWAATPPQRRAAVLRRAGELFTEHAEEIEEWLVREAGSVRSKAGFEARLAIGECFECAGLPTHPQGEVLTSEEARWSLTRRRPAGVVSVIAPFNFPLILGLRSVAPALALGNAVLLKPDPRTAVSGGVVIARIFEEAGLPAGVLHLLPGDGAVGEALVEAPEVRVISFTGSTPVGRIIGEQAGRLLKRAHLELGGNNALVVLPGADVAKAASAGAFGSYLHQGQICMTTGRHIVHESLVEEYTAALAAKADSLPVGDPARQDVALGPIIDRRQLERVHGIVEASVAAGAKVAAGGEIDGACYRATVLTGVTTRMPAWREEIFGPVAPVISFSTPEEAARIVNDCEYGLSVGILGDVGTAMKLADRIDSGKVHINEQTVSDEPHAPFGGVKASGTGSRFGGATANVEAFTETQWVTVRPDIADYPF